MTLGQIFSIVIFILIFTLIATEAIHRTYAALLGAFGMVVIGAVRAENLLAFIEIEILGFVIGLFLLVEGAERSGIFQLLASKIMVNSKNPTSFAIILLSFTMVLAVFVSNIGAMLVTATITITMAKSLRIKPQTILIFQAILINIGGMMLLMGSIPNIIIAVEGELSFNSFLVNVVPLGMILYVVTMLIFIRTFKSELAFNHAGDIRNLEFSEWMKQSIEIAGWKSHSLDRSKMMAAAIMVGTIIGFIIYENINLTPAFVALSGGCLMLMVQGNEPRRVLSDIDWSNILFLAGLFIMINGMESIGLIEMVSEGLSNLIGGTPFRASIAIMWLSGLASSVIDNIPLSTSLAPIVRGMLTDNLGKHIWWGLIVGANLGGNITPIGSPSTIISLGVSEQEGYPISFNKFFKIGLGLTMLHFLIAMLYLYIRYILFIFLL
jgi:Na+/H+ antiporter NhaD/arsenite permease-like protein